MRIPSSLRESKLSFDAAMTPMIDVVFQLIIFFVWTSSFHAPEHLLPSELSAAAGSLDSPDAAPPPEADFENVVVRISYAGGAPRWTVNDAPQADLAAVRKRLESIARIKLDAPVILHPEGEVPLGNVIDLYDLSRAIGFEAVRFAASETP